MVGASGARKGPADWHVPFPFRDANPTAFGDRRSVLNDAAQSCTAGRCGPTPSSRSSKVYTNPFPPSQPARYPKAWIFGISKGNGIAVVRKKPWCAGWRIHSKLADRGSEDHIRAARKGVFPHRRPAAFIPPHSMNRSRCRRDGGVVIGGHERCLQWAHRRTGSHA
jgi:hypothetical protein